MNITKEEIEKLKPCSKGYQWFINHGSPDLTKTLLDVNKVKPDWAAWLYARLMSEEQCKQFAIYAAEEVLHIFEAEYPNDDRPRLAIVAAKIALESNTPANREAARDAADAAYAAGAYVACAADAAGAAADAAAYGASGATYGASDAARDAARAAGDAYADPDAAGAVARVVMQERLIRKAVKMLEEK